MEIINNENANEILDNNSESAPVIEKVSIKEIHNEIKKEEDEHTQELFDKYLALSPEEKAYFKKELLKRI